MKSFKDIFISTEARAFMDTFGMSGHIRGDKRLPYCQQLRDREDKQIGYLLRNISEYERSKLSNIDSTYLDNLKSETNLGVLEQISLEIIKRTEGSISERGGRWSPKMSFGDKVLADIVSDRPKNYLGKNRKSK